MADELKCFYEEWIRKEGLPAFEDLKQEQIDTLKKSFSYDRYRLHKSIEGFKQTLSKYAPFKYFLK